MPEKLLADEELSIVSAIRDTFLPRLGERDRSVFSSIILDLWPNVDVPLDFAGGHKEQVRNVQLNSLCLNHTNLELST